MDTMNVARAVHTAVQRDRDQHDAPLAPNTTPDEHLDTGGHAFEVEEVDTGEAFLVIVVRTRSTW
jgi:hypothetical protein